MTVIRRTTATVLATVATVPGLLAAACRLPPRLSARTTATAFRPPCPQAPTGPPNTTIANSGSPWWTFVLVAAPPSPSRCS